MAIVTYNDNGTIKVVKYGNYVVSTDADPIQKDWVFVGGTYLTDLPSYTAPGTLNNNYSDQGCATIQVLHQALIDIKGTPENEAIGTQVAIRITEGPGAVCQSYAIFEVQAV